MGRDTANVSRGPGFLAAVGTGRGQGVGRGHGQSVDQSSCLGSRQGGGQGVDRGSSLGSRQGGDQDGSQGVMAGVVKSHGRGVCVHFKELMIGHMKLWRNMRDILWISMGKKIANTQNLTKTCGTKLSGERIEAK
ncbi:hypothetical protein M8C21_010092, partial [Ambrosia artemisiifolia]